MNSFKKFSIATILVAFGAGVSTHAAPNATKIVAIESFLNEFMSNDLVMPFLTPLKTSSE